MGRFKDLFHSRREEPDELAFLAALAPSDPLSSQEIDLLQQSCALGRLAELRDRIEDRLFKMKHYGEAAPGPEELTTYLEIIKETEDILK